MLEGLQNSKSFLDMGNGRRPPRVRTSSVSFISNGSSSSESNSNPKDFVLTLRERDSKSNGNGCKAWALPFPGGIGKRGQCMVNQQMRTLQIDALLRFWFWGRFIQDYTPLLFFQQSI